MSRKKLLKYLAYLIFFIFLLNYIAGKFHWYLSLWYFDMIMHFLGGLWLGFAFSWIFWPVNFSPPERPSGRAGSKSLFKVMIGVLLVGIFWEIFELFFDNYVAQNPFNILDTASDICFDLAGGLFALFYILKKIMPASEIKV